MTKVRRWLALAVCWAMVSPVIPFIALSVAAEWVERFVVWAVIDRKWSDKLANASEAFAKKHGVELL